jgi:V/A-type H+-transporting ATPase subunit I
LALIIGVVQIIFGMILKVANLWKQAGFSAALSTIGWLVLIVGGGACYGLSMKGVDVTIPTYAVAIIAGLLIFVLNDVRRNPVINVFSGLWDSYNMLTGLLGDTLSYIRLFALGISGAVLGLVFNDLAMNMSGDIPVVKQIIMLVILLFGHSVNLFMAGLGSFVHPMRLTFVEFYKNAGFEGGGKKYQPFKKR